MTTDDLMQKIAYVWIKRFGINTTLAIRESFDGDIKEILEIFIEDVDEFIKSPINKLNWDGFWSELHKLKGALNMLSYIKKNDDIVRMIECLRNNNFNNDFDIIWNELVELLKKYKVVMIEEAYKQDVEQHEFESV